MAFQGSRRVMNSSKRQSVTKSDLKAFEQRQNASLVSKTEFKRKVATLVTKAEFKREIAKLATKQELQREIAKLATKEELEIVRKKLDDVASQLALNTTDIRELKQNLAKVESTMNTKFDVVLQAIDGLAGKVDSYRTEQAAALHGLSRHDRQLDDHERRIEKLEVGAELR